MRDRRDVPEGQFPWLMPTADDEELLRLVARIVPVFVIELEPPVIDTPTAGVPEVLLVAEMLPLFTTLLLLPETLRPEVPPEMLPDRVTVMVRLLPEKLFGPLGVLMTLSASAVAGSASPKAAISKRLVISLFMARSSLSISGIGNTLRPVKQSQRDRNAGFGNEKHRGPVRFRARHDVFWEAGAAWDV